MSHGEHQLASLAAALIGDPARLFAPELELVARASRVDARVVARVRAEIMAGQDPLGTRFCSLRSAEQRRRRGATYTPAPIVDYLVAGR